MFKAIKKRLMRRYMKPQYMSDGLGVKGRNMGWRTDEPFNSAWNAVSDFNAQFRGGEPLVHAWRAHLILWAAEHGLSIEGDFVECGVHTGIYASMIYKTLPFEASGKNFFLFDTYGGIPADGKSHKEIEMANRMNERKYTFDALAVAKDVFKPYKSAKIVQGILPQALDLVNIDRIAYLSMDLNVASPELASAELLWDKLSPSAMIVLDDFGFKGHPEQYAGWKAFAAKRGRSVFHSATGQGVIIR